jgi:hypothetical protein
VRRDRAGGITARLAGMGIRYSAFAVPPHLVDQAARSLTDFLAAALARLQDRVTEAAVDRMHL